jgi:hypothetical protein
MIDSNTAVRVARAGAKRLAQLVEPNGRFVYHYLPGADHRSTRYNALRHCGAIWSMFEIVRLTGRNNQVVKSAVQACQFLLREFVRRGPQDQLCLVEQSSVKLGGNGLALLALTSLHEASGNAAILDPARSLGRYILAQRMDDGDFLHKRRYSDGAVHPFRSNYYTGQALFGLLSLHRATREVVWADAAFESIKHLSARNYGVAARHHWMLYALELANQIRPSAENYEHARLICEAIASDHSYRERGSTPIACMSEGLLAFLRLCRDAPGGVDAEVTRPYLDILCNNLELQLRDYRSDGSFVGGEGRPDVRIDYIQHNISAFAGYATLDRPAADRQIGTVA